MKKYIKLFIASVAVLLHFAVKAQQSPMYAQYMFNTLAYNPAYAGSRGVISAAALYRGQWSGLEGAPRTATLTVDAPFFDKKVGVGIQVFNDRLGITSTTGWALSYAYRFRMSEKGTLSFGLQGGIKHYRANLTSVGLNPGTGNYDQAFSQDVSKTLVNLGAGIYYNSDRFYIGLSSPELFMNKISYAALGSNSPAHQYIHGFLAAGYVLPLNQDFNLKPSILVKAVKGAPVEADLNLTLWIKNFMAIGGQYRTNADVAGMVELQLTSQIRLGYQYDYSTTSLRSFNSGSHEVMLRYEFGFSRDKVISPRYF